MQHPLARRLYRRVDCREAGLSVLLRDLPIKARVLDWSEGGIGFSLAAPVASPQPGQPLEARLLAGDRVLGVFDLIVRHVARDADVLRIGASIQPPTATGLWRATSESDAGARPIVGEADVESFYRTWFRLPEAFIVRGTGALAWLDLRMAPKSVLARPETFDLLCEQAAHVVGLGAGRPIDLVIMALGAPFLLRTEVVTVGSDRLTLRLPGRLFSLTRRDGVRVRCPAELPCFLDVAHPLLPDRSLRFRVRDLSAGGLSLSSIDELAVRPGPMRGRLVVPFRGEFEVDLMAGDVRTGEDGAVVAARLTRIGPEGRRALADLLLTSAFPEVHERDRYDPWGVREFLRGVGYLPEGESDLGADAWELSRRAGPDLAHDVVRLHDGAIVGHLSCLRLYRRTWLVHQLATASPGPDAAAGAAMVEYGAAFLDARADDMDYMIAYFNQSLPWHRLFFSGYERRMADSTLAVIHPFRRYHVQTTGIVLDRVRDRSEIASVTQEDAAEVSAFLRRAIPETALRALDLDQAVLLGAQTAEAFASRGLEWQRVVFAQRREGRLIAVAVCELATPGLNAHGITDVAKVVCEAGAPDETAVTQRALLARVKGFYLANRRDSFLLLLDPSCPAEALAAAGADFVEVTGFVAFSRAGLLDFRNFLRYEMARLSRLGVRKPPEGFGALGEPGRSRTGQTARPRQS